MDLYRRTAAIVDGQLRVVFSNWSSGVAIDWVEDTLYVEANDGYQLRRDHEEWLFAGLILAPEVAPRDSRYSPRPTPPTRHDRFDARLVVDVNQKRAVTIPLPMIQETGWAFALPIHVVVGETITVRVPAWIPGAKLVGIRKSVTY